MKFVLMIAGLLIMCVPDTAGVLRTVVQSAVGLGLFGLGCLLCLEK